MDYFWLPYIIDLTLKYIWPYIYSINKHSFRFIFIFFKYAFWLACNIHVHSIWRAWGVATISRMLKNIRLFCKRVLQKRPIFCKETYVFQHPTHRSHPIVHVCITFVCKTHVHSVWLTYRKMPSQSWLKGKFKQYKLDLPPFYRHPDHASYISRNAHVKHTCMSFDFQSIMP